MVYYTVFMPQYLPCLLLASASPPLLPQSTACLSARLSNPCLPVARETTSLATSRHPCDTDMWEGKVPASG